MSQTPLIFRQSKSIFISHAKYEDAFVTRIASDLRKENISTWVDHENILPGRDWDKTIEEELKRSMAMIVVLSPEAIKSNNVRAEWNYFLQLHDPVHIYPIQSVECDIPYRPRIFQVINFSQDYDRNINVLLKAISELHHA